MKHRTFVAVDASPEVRRAATKLIDALRPAARGVKWVAAENLHWTLQFLGDVDELDTPEVCKAVSKAAGELTQFVFAVHGAGAFPTSERPRTLWLGAGEGEKQMIDLQKAIQRRLAKRGFRGEARRYVPHLTVGRSGRQTHFAALAAELAKLTDFDAGTQHVDEVTVYRSLLGHEGPAYEVLAHASLA